MEQRPGATVLDAVTKGLDDATRNAVVDFSFHAGFTYPSAETLAEIPQLVDMGIPSFKFFLTYPNWHIRVDLGFLYEAFVAIEANHGIAAVHSEDDQIIEHLKRRFVQAGRDDLACYALARPDFAEEMAINNVGILSRETGARAYAVHVSSRKGLDAGRRAKAAGAPFFMECVPHYLMFTEDVFRLDREKAARFVMGPPYRTDRDIEALWEGIGDGSIDWMGSDHSPYRAEQKTRDLRFYSDPAGLPGGIEYAIPTGIGGVELLLPIMLSEGVNKGRITIERLVELMCESPARHLGFPGKGRDQGWHGRRPCPLRPQPDQDCPERRPALPFRLHAVRRPGAQGMAGRHHFPRQGRGEGRSLSRDAWARPPREPPALVRAQCARPRSWRTSARRIRASKVPLTLARPTPRPSAPSAS